MTSNKELVATHGDELSRIAEDHQVSYLFEASTGGGIPLLHPIMRCLSVNEITRIDGIVNGSTNYLLTKMRDEGIDFETALANAKALGYVEADPSADVNGLDAQRKASILAACAFGSRFDSGKDLPVKGIGDILADDHTAAAAFGGSIKLIAHLQLLSEQNTWTGWVHPCLVKAGHPLYSVNDVFNGIIVHGNYVDNVMFYGRGAGRRPTASAVVSDIAEIVKNIDASIMTNRCASACQPAFSRVDLPIARLFRTDTASAIVLERQNPAWHVKPLAHEAAIVTDALTQETFDHLTAGMRISEPIWVLEQT